MPDWLLWFTRLENSKIVALLIFFFTFCAILMYVYTGKKRTRRLESYKYMPFQEDDVDRTAADAGKVDKDD